MTVDGHIKSKKMNTQRGYTLFQKGKKKKKSLNELKRLNERQS